MPCSFLLGCQDLQLPVTSAVWPKLLQFADFSFHPSRALRPYVLWVAVFVASWHRDPGCWCVSPGDRTGERTPVAPVWGENWRACTVGSSDGRMQKWLFMRVFPLPPLNTSKGGIIIMVPSAERFLSSQGEQPRQLRSQNLILGSLMGFMLMEPFQYGMHCDMGRSVTSVTLTAWHIFLY